MKLTDLVAFLRTVRAKVRELWARPFAWVFAGLVLACIFLGWTTYRLNTGASAQAALARHERAEKLRAQGEVTDLRVKAAALRALLEDLEKRDATLAAANDDLRKKAADARPVIIVQGHGEGTAQGKPIPAQVNKTPVVNERAVEKKSSGLVKRAVRRESPDVTERAEGAKSPDVPERADSSESPVPSQRECLLVNGSQVDAKLNEGIFETKEGVRLFRGALHLSRKDITPTGIQLEPILDLAILATDITIDESLRRDLQRSGWGFGPLVGARKGGWVAGATLLTPEVRLPLLHWPAGALFQGAAGPGGAEGTVSAYVRPGVK